MFGLCGLLDVLSVWETSRHDGTFSQTEPAKTRQYAIIGLSQYVSWCNHWRSFSQLFTADLGERREVGVMDV